MEGRIGNLVAMAAAVLLLGPPASAEDEGEPAAGFEPGQRTFTNPFADVETEDEAVPPEPDEFSDPGADAQRRREELESRRDTPRPGSGVAGGSTRGRPGAPEKDVPAPKFTDAGVEVGGDKGGGVISQASRSTWKRTKRPLQEILAATHRSTPASPRRRHIAVMNVLTRFQMTIPLLLRSRGCRENRASL